MTVNDDSENCSKQEISDDTYWKTYFEDETISVAAYRRRLRMARKHGNQQKSEATQRLDNTQEKQTSKKIESIFDR